MKKKVKNQLRSIATIPRLAGLHSVQYYVNTNDISIVTQLVTERFFFFLLFWMIFWNYQNGIIKNTYSIPYYYTNTFESYSAFDIQKDEHKNRNT